LEAKPPTYPLQTKLTAKRCHSERSKESYYFYRTTVIFNFKILIPLDINQTYNFKELELIEKNYYQKNLNE
jgi:hypothetical protein